MYLSKFGQCDSLVVTLFDTFVQCTHLSVTVCLSPTLYLLFLCLLCVGGLWVNIVCSNFKPFFNKLNILSLTKTEDRAKKWWHQQRVNISWSSASTVVLSCFVSSSPSTVLHLFSLLLFSVFSWWKFLLPLFISSNLFSRCSGEGEFGNKSSGSWGVLGKPKARRRSTGLLRRDVIILVTCYRRACSSVYLQLLLPLGAHFNAWGWLLYNEFRNTGSQCKKRSETREARNHWLITNRSARKKNQGRTEHTSRWKYKRTRQK